MIEPQVMPAREFRRQAWVFGTPWIYAVADENCFFENLMHLDDDSRLELP